MFVHPPQGLPAILCRPQAGRRCAAAILALGVLFHAPTALAINWIGGGANTEWTTSGNWQGGDPPGLTDSANIFAGNATITGVSVPTVNSFTLGSTSTTGLLTISGVAPTNPSVGLAVTTSSTINQGGQLAINGATAARAHLFTNSLSTAGSISINSRGDVLVGGNITQLGGTITLASGGGLQAQQLNSNAGLIQATGAITADVKIGDGGGATARLSPGTGIGSLQIIGDLQLLSDARLQMQFSSATGQGTWDAVVVNGNLQLGGTLDLLTLGLPAPVPGTFYPLATARTFSAGAHFNNILGLAVAGGSWVPQFSLQGNAYGLSFTSILGDMNGDLVVDDLDAERFAWAIRDASTYTQEWVLLQGNSAFSGMADMDLDGSLTFADVPAFLTAVGATANVDAAAAVMAAVFAAPVPEPASVVLATAAIGVFIVHRRRTQS